MKGEWHIENKIYVKILEKNNNTILEFPKCNIKTIAFIGKNGVTENKREGDGKTPMGEFKVGIALGIHPKEQINTKLEYKQISPNMYWIDDPKSKYYNQLVDISTTHKKDWTSAEHLIDFPIQYEYLVELKTNPYNIPEKGSAIFLHCIKNKSTAGCIAINKYIMKKILQNVDENTKIEIQRG